MYMQIRLGLPRVATAREGESNKYLTASHLSPTEISYSTVCHVCGCLPPENPSMMPCILAFSSARALAGLSVLHAFPNLTTHPRRSLSRFPYIRILHRKIKQRKAHIQPTVPDTRLFFLSGRDKALCAPRPTASPATDTPRPKKRKI